MPIQITEQPQGSVGKGEEKMPFKSKSQVRALYAKDPELAEEFAAHTPKSAYKKLPQHVAAKPKKKKKKKAAPKK